MERIGGRVKQRLLLKKGVAGLKKTLVIVKRLLIVLSAILLGLFVMCAVLFLAVVGIPTRISTSFATKAIINDDGHAKLITNKNDVDALKKVLSGWAFKEDGTPACGFGISESVTLTDGRKSITFCPAEDRDPTFRIGNTNKYLWASDARRERFDHIVHKYGM